MLYWGYRQIIFCFLISLGWQSFWMCKDTLITLWNSQGSDKKSRCQTTHNAGTVLSPHVLTSQTHTVWRYVKMIRGCYWSKQHCDGKGNDTSAKVYLFFLLLNTPPTPSKSHGAPEGVLHDMQLNLIIYLISICLEIWSCTEIKEIQPQAKCSA